MAASVDTIRSYVARKIESISPNNNEEGRNKTFYMDSFDSLHLPLNVIEMVSVAEALSRNTHVEKVLLNGCLSGSSAAATSTFLKKILETHPSIRVICLAENVINNNLSEVIGLALKTNTSLKVLELQYNEIGPHGAEVLAEGLRQNKALQNIDLGWNKVGDAGATALAEALRTNKTLVDLNLTSNGVTSEGGNALASGLEKASLKVLFLNHNNLQDQGGKAIAKSLGKNKSLISLYLYCTDVGDETCLAISSALCNNASLSELNLAYNQRITRVGASAIEDSLKHLNYAVERVALGYNGNVPDSQPDRINNHCAQNRRLNIFFQQVNQNVPAIPLGVWPRVLETVECKPDFLYALLKTKPEVCREQQHTRRRRRHTQIG